MDWQLVLLTRYFFATTGLHMLGLGQVQGQDAVGVAGLSTTSLSSVTMLFER